MIRVQAQDYKVELVPPGLASNFVGQTLPEEQRVLVSASMHPQKQQGTFFHEMVHVWLFDESQIMDIIGHSEMEGLINRLSSNIYATLTENGLLVEDWWNVVVDERPEEEDDTSKLTTNVTEKNEFSDRRTEHGEDESLRRNGDDAKVLTRRKRKLG